MSKLMSNLKDLDKNRKRQENIIVDEPQGQSGQVHIIREHKGIYFLSFLVMLLIACSAVSVSISYKTLAQMGDGHDKTELLFKTIKQQNSDLAGLKALIQKSEKNGIARMDTIKAQIHGLELSLKDREAQYTKLSMAHDELRSGLDKSIDDLKMSDSLLLNKVTQLNDKVKEIMETNPFLKAY